MAEIIASLVEGKTDWGGAPPTMNRTVSGWSAKEFWRIDNTLDVKLAKNAPQLPKVGVTPFVGDIPTLMPVNLEFSRIGGTYDTAAQAGGFVLCEIDYATPQFGGRLPEPRVGDKYTEFRGGLDKLHRVIDTRLEMGVRSPTFPQGFEFVEPTAPSGLPWPLYRGPVKGQKGYDVFIGECQLQVTAYIADENVDSTLVGKLLRFARFQMVNKTTVRIPPIYGTNVSFDFDPGQLRYVGFEHAADRGIVRIAHTLAAGPDWFLRWAPENEFGEVGVGDPYFTVQYPAEDFNGLW